MAALDSLSNAEGHSELQSCFSGPLLTTCPLCRQTHRPPAPAGPRGWPRRIHAGSWRTDVGLSWWKVLAEGPRLGTLAPPHTHLAATPADSVPAAFLSSAQTCVPLLNAPQ